MVDTPRNPKAGVMDLLVQSPIFGEFIVPPVEPVAEPEPEPEPVPVKPKAMAPTARVGAQRPATPRTQRQKDGG